MPSKGHPLRPRLSRHIDSNTNKLSFYNSIYSLSIYIISTLPMPSKRHPLRPRLSTHIDSNTNKLSLSISL